MVCKNRGICRFLGPSWVLITYIICPPVIVGMVDCGVVRLCGCARLLLCLLACLPACLLACLCVWMCLLVVFVYFTVAKFQHFCSDGVFAQAGGGALG